MSTSDGPTTLRFFHPSWRTRPVGTWRSIIGPRLGRGRLGLNNVDLGRALVVAPFPIADKLRELHDECSAASHLDQPSDSPSSRGWRPTSAWSTRPSGCSTVGIRVVVVGDAVASPGVAHDEGIERMRAAGVELVGTKSLFYEWVRTVDRAAVVDEAMAGVPLPDGLML